DWATLKLEKDSFIDTHLRRRYADLLLSARVAGRRALFYVLVEHKRDVEPLAMVQVGRYMHRIWDKILADEPGLAKVPAIVPVLLCNTKAVATRPASRRGSSTSTPTRPVTSPWRCSPLSASWCSGRSRWPATTRASSPRSTGCETRSTPRSTRPTPMMRSTRSCATFRLRTNGSEPRGSATCSRPPPNDDRRRRS